MKLIFRLVPFDVEARVLMSKLSLNLEKPWSLASKPYDISRIMYLKDRDIFVLQVDPSFPDFFPYGLVLFGGALMIGLPWWAFIPGVLMMFSGLFHSWVAYYFGLRLGLFKAGSKAKVKRYNKDNILEMLLWDK